MRTYTSTHMQHRPSCHVSYSPAFTCAHISVYILEVRRPTTMHSKDLSACGVTAAAPCEKEKR